MKTKTAQIFKDEVANPHIWKLILINLGLEPDADMITVQLAKEKNKNKGKNKMTTSIDYFDCPRCGGNARREQNNKSNEVIFKCSDCSWAGEPIGSSEVNTYNKITQGFVTQGYLLNEDGEFICVEQFFTAGDEVSREDDDGNPVRVDTDEEIYQPFDMEQPNTNSKYQIMLDALKYAQLRLNSMTTDEFSIGKDKEIREKIDQAIIEAEKE